MGKFLKNIYKAINNNPVGCYLIIFIEFLVESFGRMIVSILLMPIFIIVLLILTSITVFLIDIIVKIIN